jgi:ring-1,2-phenylacetyl-CoA epoxidase subunit PaaC
MKGASPGLEGAPHEIQAALRRLILGLADTKRVLGIRYSEWLLGAPSIEAGIAASSMAQDEWGHARLLYAALKDFHDDPMQLEHERDASEYASWAPLDAESEDWAAVVATMFIVDGALTEVLASVLEGGYEPLEGRIAKMLAEEEFHASLAEAWFRRLAGGSDEAKTRLREACEALLEETVRCAASGDDTHERLADRGLTLPAGTLRARLAKRLNPLLKLVGLEVPMELRPTARWDARRGRTAGQPSDDAVERARGDRNRALFVE